MEEKLLQEKEPTYYTTQGDARAVAATEGSSATVNQIIVQYRTAVLVLGNDLSSVNFKALGKHIDIEMDDQGNMVINGKEVKSKEIGDGIRMVVVDEKDVQENIESSGNVEE